MPLHPFCHPPIHLDIHPTVRWPGGGRTDLIEHRQARGGLLVALLPLEPRAVEADIPGGEGGRGESRDEGEVRVGRGVRGELRDEGGGGCEGGGKEGGSVRPFLSPFLTSWSGPR